ncbi:Ig-like domain-containing protein [Patescibacteria group bacterium]|nr:Ig-like domain-containing protein [Patescibacteria group bacterium]MBP9710213.1 Ig-like domain-containing protein [Patescibacteria group bacterium]
MIRRLSAFLAPLLVALAVYTTTPLAFAAVNAPDSTFSRISVDKTSVKADGIDNARLSLTLRDSNLLPLDGAEVTLISSRGAMDEMIAEQGTTNSLGQARFLLRSLKDGTSTYTARVGDYILNRSVTVTFRDGLAISLQVGDLIKIPDDGDALNLNDTAVYYYAVNGKRYVFPNEKVFFSWYPDFSRVKIIPNDQMSLIPIGANITYRPGSRMVKFQTDPKTYVVTKGGTLRWAKTEGVARGLFGESWNQYIDDISEGFYVNYRIGTPLDSALDAPLDLIRSSVQSIDQDRGLVDNRFP